MARYHSNVYNLAYRLTGNREDAMDISQETFLRVFRGIQSFKLGKPFLPWIYRIAWNLCADRGRKIGRSLQEESFDSNEVVSAKAASSILLPGEAIENKELGETLAEAIDKLTGMKSTVIKNRLYRGRQALRQILQNSGFNW
mgnify:CR=1 FL=1